MRVLFFTTGPDSEPSSRVRVFQFLPALRRLGVECEVRPLAGRCSLELGYGLRRPPGPARAPWAGAHFLRRTARRVLDLWSARDFDVLFVQKETFPFGLERLVSWLGLRVVYDFDDAIFLASPLSDGRGRWLRRAAEAALHRSRALPALLGRCRAVVAGSPVLADYARQHAERVRLIPTVVDTDAYAQAPVRRTGMLTIGWIGAPPNAAYLEPLRPVFRELSQRFSMRLRLVGPDAFECPGVRVECTGWRHYATISDEVRDLHRFDVGIMPLPDTGFAAGKCALKAIQYMACGIPVVASPVGVNAEVVRDGECGFLADSPEEWKDRLTRLLEDPDLRAELGRAGRERAIAHYSIRAVLPQLLRVIEDAARAPSECDTAAELVNSGDAARAADSPRRPLRRHRFLQRSTGQAFPCSTPSSSRVSGSASQQRP